MTKSFIRRLRLSSLAVGLVVMFTMIGCETGSYPMDIFPEMHYQASHRTQEPPHHTSPEGSVPVTGAEAPLTDFVAILNSDSPIPFGSASIEAGRALFITNCSMCHGQDADGESYVANKFKQYQTKPPPSLRLQEVADKTDGALFWTISKGVGDMPSFTPLLTAEERWSLVNYIRSLQP